MTLDPALPVAVVTVACVVLLGACLWGAAHDAGAVGIGRAAALAAVRLCAIAALGLALAHPVRYETAEPPPLPRGAAIPELTAG